MTSAACAPLGRSSSARLGAPIRRFTDVTRRSLPSRRVPPRTSSDHALIVLNAAAGIAALGGATYALGGAPDVPTEWLDGSPFRDYTMPGLILGGVYAPAGLAAAWAVWRRHPRASEISVAAAVVQLGWIAAQLRVIGFRSFLQPLMGGVGVIDLGLAVRRLARESGCT
jgi:hypothetical protein